MLRHFIENYLLGPCEICHDPHSVSDWLKHFWPKPDPIPSGFIPRPDIAPIKKNGGIICDMDEGPCACGAWHILGEN